MENTPIVHINFKHKQTKHGLFSPPNSQNSQIEPARTLISPPPEEELEAIRIHSRSNSFSKPSTTKRKRPAAPTKSPSSMSLEATPNPKPRKRTHTRTNSQQSMPSPTRKLVQSPHVANPNADFIPPYLASLTNSIGRRRSATPAVIPAYEPPTDVDNFSPPREIFVTPLSRKPKPKRKSHGLKVETSSVKAKRERPELVDLTLHKPMPPPSPTDDPLLLKFPGRRRKRKSKAQVKDVYEDSTMPLRNSISQSVALPSPPPASPMKGVIMSNGAIPMTPPRKGSNRTMRPPSPLDQRIDYFTSVEAEEETPTAFEDAMDLDVSLHPGEWSDSDDDIDREQSYEDTFVPLPPLSSPGSSCDNLDSFAIINRPPTPDQETDAVCGRSSPPYAKAVALQNGSQPDSNISLLQPHSDDEEEALVRETSLSLEEGDDVHNPMHVDSDSDEEEALVREMSLPLEEEAAEHNRNSTYIDRESEEEEEEIQVRELSLSLEPEEESDTAYEPSVPAISSQSPTETAYSDKPFLESKDPFSWDPQFDGISQAITSTPHLDCDLEADGELVKIVSADPRTAAKAAAILKQHNYDCFTKLPASESHTGATRRKTMSDFIASNMQTEQIQSRRLTLAGVIDGTDQVYIPGSPRLATLGGLLKDAEKEVISERERSQSPSKTTSALDHTFSTPTPFPGRLSGRITDPPSSLRPRSAAPAFDPEDPDSEWSKENWRRLDSCFTDERLAVFRRGSAAFSFGSPEPSRTADVGEELAAVDAVRLEDVVNRFVFMEGGWSAMQAKGWSRSYLLQRASALQIKQRAGRGAPPSRPCTPDCTPIMSRPKLAALEVPDFTPLPRGSTFQRIPPSSHQHIPVVDQEAPKTAPVERKRVPAPLLAPRYAELLEEAEAVAASTSSHASSGPYASTLLADSTPSDPALSVPQATPQSMTGRVKGFFTSYLPTLSSTSKTQSKRHAVPPPRIGLPLPPDDILKKPRGAINTPMRAPQPKAKPHKEMVDLHHAPLPQQATRLPKPKPQRLVELNPVDLPPTPVTIPQRPRRSSGGSVKDLVKSFEDLDKSVQMSTGPSLKRVKSWVGEGRANTKEKPRWRF